MRVTKSGFHFVTSRHSATSDYAPTNVARQDFSLPIWKLVSLDYIAVTTESLEFRSLSKCHWYRWILNSYFIPRRLFQEEIRWGK